MALVVVILLVLAIIRRIGTAVGNDRPVLGFLLRLLFWNAVMVVLLAAITARWPAALNLTAQNWPWELWWFRFLEIYLKLVALGVALALIGFPLMVIAKEFASLPHTVFGWQARPRMSQLPNTCEHRTARLRLQ